MSEVNLEINWEYAAIPGLEREKLAGLLERGIKEALVRGNGPAAAEVSLTLVDDARIHELNREYRGVDRPTDVLSFALTEEDEDEPEIVGYADDVLGDIVISVERAVAQAEEYGHSLEREIVFLAVHGTLHLLGYDHVSDPERQLMRQKEEEVMAAIGLRRD